MDDKNITDHMKNQWEFDEEVTKVFDEMLERSIPDYKNMRNLVNVLVRQQLSDINYNSRVMDIGCSNCGAIQELLYQFPNAEFVGIDNSESMIKEAQRRYRQLDNLTLMYKDLRTLDDFPLDNLDVCLSVLTLQFIPIEYRYDIVSKIYDSLKPNGIFIFVEKVMGQSPYTNKLFNKLYYDQKKDNYYSELEINSKKSKLERILVPTTDTFNKELLINTGFKNVDMFWKSLNFSGYIAFK